MAQPVRVGIVGCGDVLQAYRAPLEALRGRGLIELVAACSRSEARRALVREALGIADFTTDYRELVRSPQVDLVLVLTSMPEHGPITRAALEAGKHVLVEKPVAVTLEEAAEIVELSTRSAGYLVCAPFVTLSPTYQAISERLRQGEIGKVLSARGRYGWAGPWWGEWFYSPGGGALFDVGVYSITSLTGWLGPARRVMAMTGAAIPEREVNGKLIRVEAEDNAQVLIDFGDAIFAVVTAGFTIQKYRCPALELYGSEGTLQMLGDDWAPDGYELWRNDVGAWQIFPETDRSWNWTDGLRHLVECIHEQKRPLVTPEHAYHVLEIMIKAQQSGAAGRDRPIESRFAPLRLESSRPHEAAQLIHDPTRRTSTS
jgi:predicted dehydrogenase